jgi:hypothetical protein
VAADTNLRYLLSEPFEHQEHTKKENAHLTEIEADEFSTVPLIDPRGVGG